MTTKESDDKLQIRIWEQIKSFLHFRFLTCPHQQIYITTIITTTTIIISVIIIITIKSINIYVSV